jgi:transposase-like protein
MLKRRIRRAVRARGHFPNEQAALKRGYMLAQRRGTDLSLNP